MAARLCGRKRPLGTSEPEVKSGRRKAWRTAAECIDWSFRCPSIFNRERPLRREATMRRIARGIRKFVIESDKPFIIPVTHHGGENRSYPLDHPLHTVTAAHRGEMALVAPSYRAVPHGRVSPAGDAFRTRRRHSTRRPLGTDRLQHLLHQSPPHHHEFRPSALVPVNEPVADYCGGQGKPHRRDILRGVGRQP